MYVLHSFVPLRRLRQRIDPAYVEMQIRLPQMDGLELIRPPVL